MATPAAPRTDLPDVLEPVRSDLEAVGAASARVLEPPSPQMEEMVGHAARFTGKRLRPALTCIASRVVRGAVSADVASAAAIVELIHTATLVHDDVIDEADLRRHLATVNARWDNEASVLLGDFLFTHAFYLASTLPTPLACRLLGQATNIVCEG